MLKIVGASVVASLALAGQAMADDKAAGLFPWCPTDASTAVAGLFDECTAGTLITIGGVITIAAIAANNDNSKSN